MDVGCSIGTFAIEFAAKGYRSFGIDFDQTALDIARDDLGVTGPDMEEMVELNFPVDDSGGGE